MEIVNSKVNNNINKSVFQVKNQTKKKIYRCIINTLPAFEYLCIVVIQSDIHTSINTMDNFLSDQVIMLFI